MTRKEKAAAIRTELKTRFGWTSRQVSVRFTSCSIEVTVKDPDVPLKIVEEIANQHEVIHRCEFSFEILSGANTFVSVEYDPDVVDAYAKPVAAKLSDEPGRCVMVAGFEVARENRQWTPNSEYYVYGKPGDFDKRACNKLAAARGVVIEILSNQPMG